MARYLLTGGSSGLGAQAVVDLAAMGHDVAFTTFREPEAAETVAAKARAANPTGKIWWTQMDVRDPGDVETGIDAAADALGDLDVAVCNAGITRTGLLMSMPDADWQDVIDINLTGAFNTCRQVLPLFLARRHGRFVHISSIASKGMSGQASYCASKAGLEGLSRAIAKEYGRKGITSNVVSLGLFDSGLTESDASDATVQGWGALCPAARMGDPAELARAIDFLGSPEAGFINGTIVSLNGGLSEAPS